jgi:CelD/BcsL family acetyltransferase involved in cellulose biosynthesis
MRKLGKFNVDFKTQHDFRSVKEAMQIFFKLHQKRWESKGQHGAFASKSIRDFHLDLSAIFDEKGWLSLYFLSINNEPVAAVYSFDYSRKKYGYLTGFDPEFAQYGVGNVLKMHVIRECIRKGFKEYDLTREFEPYKREWTTGVRRNLVARMVIKGWFAEMYNWALSNGASRARARAFLVKKLKKGLALEQV